MSDIHGRLVVITDSTSEPVSRKDVKAWLKIEEEDLSEDAVVDALIVMARQRYEAHAQRALLRKTYDYVLDALPSDTRPLRLPRSPLVSVSSITGYSDTDGSTGAGTVMNSTEYFVDTASEPGRVLPYGNFTFPSATRVANAAIVRFVAGYSTDPVNVPAQIQTTLKQMIARAYEFRGDHTQRELEAAMDTWLADDTAIPSWG